MEQGEPRSVAWVREQLVSKHPELKSGFAILHGERALSDRELATDFMFERHEKNAPEPVPFLLVVPAASTRLCVVQTQVRARGFFARHVRGSAIHAC